MTDPGLTLELLRSECETCGAWGVFTGRTQLLDGQTYAVVRCPGEGVEFLVWSERGAAVLEAYERARSRSRPDLGLLRSLGERLSSLTRPPDPEPDDVRAALGVPADALPLGSNDVRVDGGWLPTVELFWDGDPQVSRADLDAMFGVGQSLPRTGPGAPYVLAYNVPVPGAASKVVVFGSFPEIPGPESGARRILLRVDLPPVERPTHPTTRG